MDRPPWNHNIHYQRVAREAIPSGARDALDVGSGDGLLAAELAGRVPSVTAIDPDPGCAARTRARLGGGEHAVICGDVLRHDFAGRQFDVVASVATLHHMDLAAGLARMAELVRLGGVLAVVGLARSRGIGDLAHDVAGMLATRVNRIRRSYWEHGAPICWPPPDTYAEVRQAAERLLPGVRYRRHLMWRYSLVWTKPVPPGAPRG